MEKYKSKLKSELAQAAGVSLPTFRRWLLSDQEELRKWAYLHRPRFCHPWLSDTFARNTALTSTEPHKTKKYERIRKEQKGEERNRKPFLFFVIPLQRISLNRLTV